MPSVIEDAPRLHDALNLLQKASSTPPKQRTFKVSGVVDVICRHAFDYGLEPDALRDVVNLVSVKTHLDQSSVTTLVKNLYPAQRIPSDVVVTIVGALGQGKGKPSPSSQDCLVKWLTTVHEIIEDTSTLSRLYGVLFAMLDMISIRTSLCHLLSLITRRKHVKPFRIQQILELSRGLSNEPALQGLLRIYKDYYPDIILGSASTSRKSFAPQPDAEWRAKIFAIQEAYTAIDDASDNRHNGFKVSRNGLKRSQVSVIPDVHTYHATEASVTLEGIDNVEDFVEKLEQIEPPGQMVSFLTDSLLQKYVDLRPSSLISSRIDLWLGACFEDLYQADRLESEHAKSRSEVLEGLLKYAQYTKELPSTVSAFLKDYVTIWDGQSDVDTVLALLAYLPLDPFEDTYATFLQPVERTLAGHGLATVERLMQFYTDLLQRQVCRTASNTSQYGSSMQHSFVPLVEHVATLAISLLVSLPSLGEGKAVLSSILYFYEKLAASSKPHAIPIILPPMHTVYLLAQQSSPEPFSRLCGIISSYKQAFDEHPKPVKDYYATHITDALNWCLRDIYNILWVSRGLITTERKAAGLYCDPNLRTALNTYLMVMDREYAIGNALGFSHNPWLNSMSATAWRAIEEREIDKEDFDRNSIRFHEGPVNQRSLEVLKKRGGVSVDWDGPQGYKVFVLNWMAERGMSGARDLMFATVSDLRGKV